MKPKDRENDWQFWAVVVVVCIVLYAGLRAFHRYTQLGRSLSVDGLSMIGTTLVAAATGFVAILYQVRSSSKQLRDQMKAQRDAEREEQERQKKAVATAILFEIDGFYGGYLRQPRDFLADRDIEKDELPLFTSIGTNPFPVYEGNTGKIGELPVECVQAVVGFFREADRIVSNFNDYEPSLELARQLRNTVTSGDIQTTRAYTKQLGLARAQLTRINDALPELIKLAYLVCHTLCQFTGVPFEYPKVSVAREELTVGEITASASDPGPKRIEGKQAGNY